MQLAGSIVNHPTAHRDRVLQCFLGDPDLFQRVNPACRNRQIDRASADDVPFAGVSAPLVKIYVVSAPSEICREQSPRQSAADQNKFCHFRSNQNLRIRNCKPLGKRSARECESIYESEQESRKDAQRMRVSQPLDTDALQFLERVAQVIKNVAWQQRLLTLVAVKNCDLRCATA